MAIIFNIQYWQRICRFLSTAVLTGMIIAIWGCAKPAPYIRKTALVPTLPRYQVGWASWYGPGFHGRTTSSGEIFNMYDLTAAHRTLPLGATVMVTRLDNGRAVKVRINDRGPFVEERIVDLSYAAARILDMERDGLARVRLEVLDITGYPSAEESRQTKYTVQVGSFVNQANATNLKVELDRKFNHVFIHPYSTLTSHYYRVRVGIFHSREAAIKTARELATEGHRVFISPLD